MEYNFYYPDYNPRKNICEIYPELTEVYKQPIAYWLGSNFNNPIKLDKLYSSITRLINRAKPQLPIFVVYSIPNRDLGQYSKGGEHTAKQYKEFIYKIALAIGDTNSILIYEPDALAHSYTMSVYEREKRFKLIKESLDILVMNCNAKIYIDAGNCNWLKSKIIVKYLNKININKIQGFSLNVCNYYTTEETIKYGKRITKLINKPFVIDTSRNGNGSNGEWCNPKNRSLGIFPTTDTGVDECDAYLWIKVPGESDGTRNGGPKAGRFWVENALELIHNYIINRC